MREKEAEMKSKGKEEGEEGERPSSCLIRPARDEEEEARVMEHRQQLQRKKMTKMMRWKKKGEERKK